MTAPLFDLEPSPVPQLHACTGIGCAFCAGRTGAQAKDAGTAAVVVDHEWAARAESWLEELWPGAIVTAEDLEAEIGMPVGSSNQVGARFRAWNSAGLIAHHGYQPARRASSHGRVIRTWKAKP